MGNMKSSAGGQRTHTVTHKVDPSLLKAEISFWQEMIRFRSATMTDESLERMHQALALAQCKLENVIDDESAINLSRQPAGNVYCIRTPKNRRKN